MGSRLLVLFLFAALMHTARTLAPTANPHVEGAAVVLAAGFVVVSAFLAGRATRDLRLPQLTGFILAGVAFGPYGLGLLSPAMVTDLKLVNGVAIALITLTAGAEMNFRAMRPLLGTIALVCFFCGIVAIPVLALTLWALKPWLPFLGGMGTTEGLAFCTVIGIVLVAQSPAVALAVRSELRAEGPLSRVVMAVTVVTELLVVVCFALGAPIAKTALGDGGDFAESMTHVAIALGASAVAGLGVGAILILYLRFVNRSVALFALGMAVAVAEVGMRLELDPPAIALVAGIVVENGSRHGQRLLDDLSAASLPVFLVFFSVAGANLPFPVLTTVAVPVAVIAVVRGLVFFVGARAAAKIAKSPPAVARSTWLGLLPQAGVTIGFTAVLANAFPRFADEVTALVIGSVALHLLVPPALYRIALVRAGEVGRARTTDAGGAPSTGEPTAENASPAPR